MSARFDARNEQKWKHGSLTTYDLARVPCPASIAGTQQTTFAPSETKAYTDDDTSSAGEEETDYESLSDGENGPSVDNNASLSDVT